MPEDPVAVTIKDAPETLSITPLRPSPVILVDTLRRRKFVCIHTLKCPALGDWFPAL